MSILRKRSVSNCDDVSPLPKKRKAAILLGGHYPVLRSGLVVRHPLIVEAATMQVESLAKFELASSAETSPPPASASQSTDASIITVLAYVGHDTILPWIGPIERGLVLTNPKFAGGF
ncbi:unnamed protein product [Phytophthora fragariaefolia]|uniref:Unnamed protein product n=1 Tax=Phytophthora fragariaefolia TaxID=1490495 RepID=A0A9W6TMY0_9STRA|nr:unnamed protein product [Phytophthora fragariaefolia]